MIDPREGYTNPKVGNCFSTTTCRQSETDAPPTSSAGWPKVSPSRVPFSFVSPTLTASQIVLCTIVHIA